MYVQSIILWRNCGMIINGLLFLKNILVYKYQGKMVKFKENKQFKKKNLEYRVVKSNLLRGFKKKLFFVGDVVLIV